DSNYSDVKSVSLLDTPAVFDSLPTLPSVGADTARCTLGESLLETNLYETKKSVSLANLLEVSASLSLLLQKS
ncbi:hypothetical protein ScalyP_jg11339, partial [Parmales sp. scaly parma]